MISASHSILTYITDIGDGACLLALCAACGVYLLIKHAGRAAVFLFASLFVSASLIGILKLGFMGCRSIFHHSDVASPSGHIAMSTAVFGGCIVLMRRQLEAKRRMLPTLLLAALVGAICFSRVELHFHTWQEALIGLLAGSVSLLFTYFFILRGKSVALFDAYALALWAVLAIIVIHGNHLRLEDWVRDLALHIRGHVHLCAV